MWQLGVPVGPYILIKKLGEGQFGEVWLAEKKTPIVVTQVALKLPKSRVKFADVKKEAKVWEQAKGHPNVLPIIDADIHNGQIYIASEYSSDGSLDDWLKQHGGKAPSISMAIEMIRGILGGLEHLHKRQIIHRDLKPANILLQGEIPRITDFGIAKFLPSGTESNFIKGSPAYMSPEALSGVRNEQTDLWSSGVIFYQLICGSLPFQGDSIPSLMHSIIHNDINPLPYWIPSHIQAFIVRSLKKDILQRYQSATDMKETLLRTNLSFSSENENNIGTTLQMPFKNYINSEKIETVFFEVQNQNEERLVKTSEQSTVIKSALPTKTKKTFPQVSKPKMRPFDFEGIEIDINKTVINHSTKRAWAFTEKLSDSIFLEMVEIPGGTFLMGSPNSESSRTGFESPQHKVALKRFVTD